MTSSDAGFMPHGELRGHALAEALAASKGARPIESAEDLAVEGVFESDAELDEFLTWVRKERRAHLA
ncbi:hypothetical protein GCM10012275_48980 [Longimycelium tulufanense]|uniref:Uncharacterized protein n=1 Tax=Longimycelium tulufanense TaxID=907463 RepID=A0A8J3FX91_9PSEU|nr:hypothetical protein GCM10012275_48980 [Longimycelium tulufanense]